MTSVPGGEGWPAHVAQVLDTLAQAGFQAYVVGGSVRDQLLGRPCHDHDVATDATPDAVMALFPRHVPTGLRHGTVTVFADAAPDEPVEVTTFRIEDRYSDGRRPDCVRFTGRLELDLARRDFTINAMAMDRAMRLVDPFGGADDLARRTVRSVGDPDERFCEDALRILRGLRLAAELGFSLHPATRSAMERQAKRLRHISLERIGQEMARIAAADWGSIARELATGPYLTMLPPPFAQLRAGLALLAGQPEHLAGWNQVVRRTPAWTGEERQAASLAVWVRAAGGTPAMASALAKGIRWPGRVARLGAAIVAALAEDLAQAPPAAWRLALWRHGPQALGMACRVLDWREDPLGPPLRWSRFEEMRRTMPLWNLGDLAVDGRALAALGLAGEAIGRMKHRLAEAVLTGEAPNDPSALLQLARTLLERPPIRTEGEGRCET
ncbi:tRNA cytidylyltransferase [Alicyclobacillus sp.]|uniref:CCA tRNA nucleotidyltransferase n=1 Tax=Alicyclobacillus sp. TaxID=61169 RepID=UPI0025C1A5F9|nr:tRNA cytidylyltransferase [Alicyclobacillus sp.]MCL6515528.1 tRNA cytidylyltransferase [Alicyclobacillus sp.]